MVCIYVWWLSAPSRGVGAWNATVTCLSLMLWAQSLAQGEEEKHHIQAPVLVIYAGLNSSRRWFQGLTHSLDPYLLCASSVPCMTLGLGSVVNSMDQVSYILVRPIDAQRLEW